MKVTLLGFGTVGMELAQAMLDKTGLLTRIGEEFKVVAVADSASAIVDGDGLNLSKVIQDKKSKGRVGGTKRSALDLVGGVESDVVVELTPGNPVDGEPALSHIKAAVRESKNVVTANKMPLALHYSELLDEASRKGVRILYGACVGGGLPVLDFGKICGSVEAVEGFDAVLNATSNLILSKMQDEGTDYASALVEAQRMGYAEADPSLDVDGFDAAAKLVILANHVMGTRLSLKDVNPLEGIREIDTSALRTAAAKGKEIRPLAALHGGARVGPGEVEVRDPLNVHGPRNAVVFHCLDSGDRSISGIAGGGVSTSRAVLRDLVSLAGEDW